MAGLSRLSSNESMSFTSLPSELHLHILAQLDLVSLLNATATNHYFQGLLSIWNLKNALLAHEPVLLEARKARQKTLMDTCQTRNEDCKKRTFENIVYLPCYSCLKIKDLRNNFHEYVEGTEWRLCGKNAQERLCVHCDVHVSPVAEPFVMKVIDEYRQKNKPIARARNLR